jgi:hypothetical protein
VVVLYTTINHLEMVSDGQWWSVTVGVGRLGSVVVVEMTKMMMWMNLVSKNMRRFDEKFVTCT